MPSRPTVMLSLLLTTPAVIFWLWLVTVPVRVAVLCREECWCDIGVFHVSCRGPSLNAVPLILTDVRILSLDNNNITLLERDGFVTRGLTELEILDVSYSGLRTIELGAFSGLTKLR
jgi:hypothetical protein